MEKRIKRRSRKASLPPGTLVHIGEERTSAVRISVMDYSEEKFEEREVKTVEECFPFKDTPTTTWINVDGIHQLDIIEKIGQHFGVHPLVLEDIANTEQRSKAEDFEAYLFIVLKMLDYNTKDGTTSVEQLSLILGPNFVVSFQEKPGDIFGPVRERIRKGGTRIRKGGADYLAYALIDTVVDNYFVILEKIGERVETIEDKLVSNPVPETLQNIYDMKQDIIALRKSVWPLREILG
ncbi:MAG: magnesium and cobalt transport protein CorA, partial [Candidatus Micrarchaeota archaeon]